MYRTINIPLILILLMVALTGCSPDNSVQSTSQLDDAGRIEGRKTTRPNILLIVADDLGYTDLGVFGGEIETPNLDKLAQSGMLLTNFHTAPTCSPTRSMLLSGTDHHLAGLGSMAGYIKRHPELVGQPGYEGYLNFRVASLAELLKDAGYHTYMTGKWHLGLTEAHSPAAHGFEKSFVLLEGGGGHLSDLGLFAGTTKATYREDGKLAHIPRNFYSSRFYAEKMIEYLRQGQADDKPFFAYLAFTAPHWPLQAPQESIKRYKGRYDKGYEALFEQRLQRQKALGLVPEDVNGPPLLPNDKKWDTLSTDEKKRSSRIMEIYSAMITDMDKYTGRVIESLKEMGEYNNTLIFFMSDNGAEGTNIGQGPGMAEAIKTCCDNSYENMGNADSYLWLGSAWARASVGAARLYKRFTTEGGIHTPAFVSYPGRIKSGSRYNGFVSVMDVMPTFLELAATKHPGTMYKGRKVLPMKGISMYGMLTGKEYTVHKPEYVMGWELFDSMAVRKGDWKITLVPPPLGDGQWGLYNLTEDPVESTDISAQHPEKFRELMALWNDYVRANGVQLAKSQSNPKPH